jgi:DnaJ like chaperone protein
MSWWGKIIGGTVGFVLGGPLAAALGAALGHQLDKEIPATTTGSTHRVDQERVQTAFFTGTFSVLGHLCKVDGRVSESEIRMAEQIMSQMDLTPAQRKTGIRLFDYGKRANFPLDDTLFQLRREIGHSRSLCRMFLEIQISAAYADGTLHPAETRVLDQVRRRLRITPAEYQHIEAIIRTEANHGHGSRHGGGRQRKTDLSLNEAYTVLNVSRDATDSEIKRAYRRLMSQHHPDKLVARGMPEEMMRLASQKTHEIREAYNRIKDDRHIQ